MAAVALQRELDAYNAAIGDYVKEARRYKFAANAHNANIDAYKDSFVKDSSGEIALFFPSKTSYMGINSASGMGFKKTDSNYVAVKVGGDVALQYKDKAVPKPGEFSMAQPASPGPAPSVTAAQMKRLDQPSLTDIERTGGSGLISSAFNY
jgi:hypothetical protein